MVAEPLTLASILTSNATSKPRAGTSGFDLNCPDCHGGGRVTIPGFYQDGTPHTAPCARCARRLRARLTSWRSDPAYGGCPECGELCDLPSEGVAIPHRHGDDGKPADDTEEEFVKRCYIPHRYASCRVENWNPPPGQQDCREFLRKWVRGWPEQVAGEPLRLVDPVVVLRGKHGTGKTHLAIGVMFAAYRFHRLRSRFWPVVNLLDRYKATFDEDRATETADSIDAEMRRTPLLVLDDLGANKSSEWAEERLFRLIDERYREQLPLVVTTNLTPRELPARVASRLGSGLVVTFTGDDQRGTYGGNQ